MMRFDELELMLMAMFEQPTLKDTIQVLTEVQPLVAEDPRDFASGGSGVETEVVGE